MDEHEIMVEEEVAAEEVGDLEPFEEESSPPERSPAKVLREGNSSRPIGDLVPRGRVDSPSGRVEEVVLGLIREHGDNVREWPNWSETLREHNLVPSDVTDPVWGRALDRASRGEGEVSGKTRTEAPGRSEPVVIPVGATLPLNRLPPGTYYKNVTDERCGELLECCEGLAKVNEFYRGVWDSPEVPADREVKVISRAELKERTRPPRAVTGRDREAKVISEVGAPEAETEVSEGGPEGNSVAESVAVDEKVLELPEGAVREMFKAMGRDANQVDAWDVEVLEYKVKVLDKLIKSGAPDPLAGDLLRLQKRIMAGITEYGRDLEVRIIPDPEREEEEEVEKVQEVAAPKKATRKSAMKVKGKGKADKSSAKANGAAKKVAVKGKGKADKSAAKSETKTAPPVGKKGRNTNGAVERKPRPRGDNKFSAIDAAAKVLEESGKPLSPQEIVERMTKKGYWSPGHGKTPDQTIKSAMYVEMKKMGKKARFAKVGRGEFVFNQ